MAAVLQLSNSSTSYQGMWWDESPLQMMPYIEGRALDALLQSGITSMPDVMKISADRLRKTLQPLLSPSELSELVQVRLEASWQHEIHIDGEIRDRT